MQLYSGRRLNEYQVVRERRRNKPRRPSTQTLAPIKNMDISSTNFRDNTLTQVTIGYDWVNSNNYAIINIAGSNNSSRCYRISGLTEYNIYDDFKCMAITQCKLIQESGNLYLSLDPYNELGAIEEKDNFCFWGKSIEMVPSQC